MTISHIAKSLLLAGVMTVATGTPGRAEPINVRFQPPNIQLPKAGSCTPRIRDEDMIAEWTAWDQKALPDRKVYAITRDMNRMRDLDARRFEPVINRIRALLPTVKADYDDKAALFDQVKLMLAKGESEKVRQDGMVASLLAAGGHAAGALNTLADYLIDGKGIEADRARGLKLKVEAAYGGSADAILDLARLTNDGETVDGWRIQPDLAVNMAFGALVGVLDEGICDRMSRIAREYEDGSVVVQDYNLTQAWYRFAADLGDSTAAWKVAELNLLSETVEKDNAVLVKYLTMAADGGNMSAILELGRLYAEGALVPRDRDRALALYRQAEDLGNQAGLVKQAQLLEETKDTSAADLQSYEDVLRRLTEAKDPPSFAFTRLARLVQAKSGIWNPSPEVRSLLEKAVAGGDIEGGIDLAELLLRHDLEPSTVTRATDLLARAIHINGEINAIAKLQKVHLCVDPSGPDFAAAAYWGDVEAGAGNKTLDLDPEQIDKLPELNDPYLIAAIQTQALYGRASALALYQRYLKTAGYSDQVLRFWDQRAQLRRGATVEGMLIEFKQNVERGALDKARRSIHLTSDALTVDAGLSFAHFLVKNYAGDHDSMVLAKEILVPLAEGGAGRAVQLLMEIDANDTSIPSPVTTYRPVMQERGDMTAQLLLAEQSTDETEKGLYYQRAISAQRCDYDDTMALADYALKHRKQDAERWLSIAANIASDDGWRKVKIADTYASMKTEQGRKIASKLYAEAKDAGEPAAYYRLIATYADETSPEFDLAKASAMFTELVRISDIKDVPQKLVMLGKMDPQIRQAVSQQIDIRDLYQQAAAVGQPVAMRELAKLMRGETDAKASAEQAFEWLKKSAEAGDGEAMYLLSQSYAFGSGTEPRLDAAQHWMAEAAKAGYPAATAILKLNTAKTEG
ncbi:tetratricopeptide repeat protein [Rhizobium sp. AAP43]|uniref:tetratricopeptide repeat protein n=1 Tax=Rhizobium sp. AAP43 TaxID=1523420 RepID=UPI0006B88E70|nr:SEL1-like repeat protein [Rhizobium sp. AAP43]KPF46084.1 hypothetical protein IP76_03950 [Rhizobium sp. AAP43]